MLDVGYVIGLGYERKSLTFWLIKFKFTFGEALDIVKSVCTA